MNQSGVAKDYSLRFAAHVSSGMENRRAVKPSFPFPGIAATADGSEAVVWVESHVTQGACAYPITPSTNMGGGYQLAVANGQRTPLG
jgi:hypothetical protein